MELTVLVYGKLGFAADMLHSISRLFSGANHDNIMMGAGVLMILMIFLSAFKFVFANETAPNPLKEFFIGTVTFVIFVGGATPRFDVTLESYNEPLNVRTIDDVPLLIAVPPWIASNLFGGLRDLVEQNLTSSVYALDEKSADPLGALIKLHDLPLSNRANHQGGETGVDYGRSIQNYVSDCYILDHQLRGTPANISIAELNNTPINEIMNGLQVTAALDGTNIFITVGDADGELLDCNDAYARLTNAINGGVFQTQLTDYYTEHGVREDAIRVASDLLIDGGAGVVEPSELMAGRFVAYHVAETLSQGYSNVWTNYVVHQAMQKRVYEATTTRALALQIMIPLVTLFETFAFYVAPIMVFLSVMGSIGFSMLGKYMYIILFINLQGFVKVFVDFYTYKTVEETFKVGGIQDALNFGTWQSSVIEIEGLLTVAGNMTAAIPMLVMFLLYGGVHALQGVMRGMNVSGSPDTSPASPTLANPMKGLAGSTGNMSYNVDPRTGNVSTGHKSLDHAGGPSGAISTNLSAGVDATRQIAANEAKSAGADFTKALTQGYTSASQSATKNGTSNTEKIDEMNGFDRTHALARQIQSQYDVSDTAANQMAFALQQNAGVGTPGGSPISFGISESLQKGWSEKEQEVYKEMQSSTLNSTDNLKEGGGWQQTLQSMKDNSASTSWQDSTEGRAAYQAAEKYSQSITESESISSKLGTSFGSANRQSLNYNDLVPELMHSNVAGNFLDRIGSEGVQRLEEQGIDVEKLRSHNTNDASNTRETIYEMSKVSDQLLSAGKGETLEQQKQDLQLASALWGEIAGSGNENTDWSRGAKEYSNNLQSVASTVGAPNKSAIGMDLPEVRVGKDTADKVDNLVSTQTGIVSDGQQGVTNQIKEDREDLSTGEAAIKQKVSNYEVLETDHQKDASRMETLHQQGGNEAVMRPTFEAGRFTGMAPAAIDPASTSSSGGGTISPSGGGASISPSGGGASSNSLGTHLDVSEHIDDMHADIGTYMIGNDQFDRIGSVEWGGQERQVLQDDNQQNWMLNSDRQRLEVLSPTMDDDIKRTH